MTIEGRLIITCMHACYTCPQVLIWDKHASPIGIAALCVCLCGGALYEQAPLRRPKGYVPVVQSASVTPLDKGTDSKDPERADNDSEAATRC